MNVIRLHVLWFIFQHWASNHSIGTTITQTLLAFEALLFAIFTAIMFATQLSAICRYDKYDKNLPHSSFSNQLK